MPRLFVPPEAVQGDRAIITGEPAHRITRVLRLSPGDEVVLLDGSGTELLARLNQLAKNAVTATILSRSTPGTEPTLNVALYQGLLKGDKFEWVLQKGTELGISTFVPLICHRSVPGLRANTVQNRMDRWRKILSEAAEQCGRAVVPALVQPTGLQAACRGVDSVSLGLIPWEAARCASLKDAIRSGPHKRVHLFIGPEGGFQPEEVEFARGCGIIPVSLGRRILRAETAGLVAAAAIMYEAGELEG